MRGLVGKARLLDLFRVLGERATSPGRIYLVSGGTALLEGWREKTVDVDLKLDPQPGGIFSAIEKAKKELGMNVELAAPDQFVPPLPGWESRSIFICHHGLVDFFNYDPYGQVLAKLERGHNRDRCDVRAMIDMGWVKPTRLKKLFEMVRGNFNRYPAVDPDALERAIQELIVG